MADAKGNGNSTEWFFKGLDKERAAGAACYSEAGKPLHRKETAMPRQKEEKGASVSGPYREANGRFRLVVFDGQTRSKPSYGTEKEAIRAKTKYEKDLQIRQELTVEGLLEQYHHHQAVVRQVRTVSHTNSRIRIERFFGEQLGLLVRSITPAKAEELYHRHIASTNRLTGQPISTATQHGDLKQVRAMYRWAERRGIVPTNPFAKVELIGKPNRGKRQFTVDQARKFLAAAVSRFVEQGDRMALAAAIVMTTGARAAEVLQRQVCELDEGGAVLVVREREAKAGDTGAAVKNRKSERRLEIHPHLRSLMQTLAEGRPPEALLFRIGGGDVHCGRVMLRLRIRQICQAEGLPLVTTHSFRGLYATIAFRKLRDPNAVAEIMGHSDFATTKNAYLDPRAAARAQMAAAGERLGLRDPQAEAERLVAELPLETLQCLALLLPGRLPGLVMGSSDRALGDGTSEFIPNRSQARDRPQISDGET